MAVTLNFYFKDNHIYLSYYCQDGRLQFSTGIKITKTEWGEQKFTKQQQTKMNRLDLLATQYVSNCEMSNTPILKEGLKKELVSNGNISGKKASTGDQIKSISNVLKEIRIMMEEKKVVQKNSKPFSSSVIRIISAIEAIINKYPFLAIVRIDKFKENELKYFRQILINENKSQNTMAVYLVYLKSVFSITYKLKWHSNEIFKNEDFFIPWEQIDYAVYCSYDELDKMLNLHIPDDHVFITPGNNKKERRVSSATLRKARDLFVFGCQVALRHCDLFELTEEKMDGWVINMNTQKTGETVFVPMNKIAKEIWIKYKGNIPKFHATDFNHCIREIGRLAGLNEKILFTRTQGGKKIKKYLPKWQLLGTHSMRRSCATNLYIGDDKRGIPPLPSARIMLLTGHRSEKSFFKYIRLKGKENAQDLFNHPAFQ